MNRFPWILAIVLVAGAWVTSAVAYTRLPERVPTHWDLKGRVDGYGSRGTALLPLPITMTVFLGFFWGLPYLSPKDFQVDTFRSTYLRIMNVTLALFLYMHGVAIYAAVHPRADIVRALIGGVFFALALIGNLLGKVRRNFYIGVRVPWTLANDRVWNDTHRVAGWVLVAGGLAGFVLTILGASLLIALAVFGVSMVIPIVYSFVHYKQLERRGEI